MSLAFKTTGGSEMLRVKRLGLMTQDEPIVLMHARCHVAKSEGLASRARVLLRCDGREIIATLYEVDNDWLALDEAGLSEAAWTKLEAKDGDVLSVRHPPSLDSLAEVRRRIYGGRLDASAFSAIVGDIVSGRYADIHLATFIAACSAFALDVDEIRHLTGAMVGAGERLVWPNPVVLDKHCVGGLPGNRTTPIVVAIGACHGLIMPKTSSRAITSPSGTADAMETITRVDLDLEAMRAVVECEGACMTWGGAMRLSPADEVLIRIERALDIDTEGQLIASVLSKKIAAGATHVVLEVPVGPTAKVRTESAAQTLIAHMRAVAESFGIQTRFVISDGSQPVGRGIGPALEARDVLAVLNNAEDAPADLRARAIAVAAAVLELGGVAADGEGARIAAATIEDGRALAKFKRICQAQGLCRSPPEAPLKEGWAAPRSGVLTHINNRKLARLAKLAGAPDDKAAGVELHAKLGETIAAGQPIVTVHAEAPGELAYALAYARANADMFEIEA